MKFRVSERSERLVGKLDAGEDLVEVLTQLCEDHSVRAGEVRAVGHFDSVELVHFDGRTQSYETVVDGEGSFDLVGLNGNVSSLGGQAALQLTAVFSAAGPVGQQMVGGLLRRARAVSGEFVVESFLDLEMERRLDSASGRLVLDRIERKSGLPESGERREPEDSDSGDAQRSMSWDQAIAEVDETEQARKKRRDPGRPTQEKRAKKADPYDGLDLDEPLISTGDLLDHPKLGRCRVLDIEDDQYVRIRLPRGRIRKLALEVLDIEYQGKEDGKPLFLARVRR